MEVRENPSKVGRSDTFEKSESLSGTCPAASGERPQNPLSRWLPGIMYCYYYAQLLYILVTLEAWEILDSTVLPLIPLLIFCYKRLRA